MWSQKSKNINLLYQRAGLIGLLFLFIFSGCSTTKKVETIPFKSKNYKEENCSPQVSQTWYNYMLLNNQWGSYKVKSGKVDICTYVYPGSSDTLFGWTFKMPDKPHGVVAYPEVFYGANHWHVDRVAAHKAFKKLDEVHHFDIEYNALLQTNGGKMNLATDVWIIKDSIAYQKAIHTEIMVWEYADNFKPNGKKVGDITTSQGVYEVRIGKIVRKQMGLQWQYAAFVRKDQRTSGTIPMKEFLDYLIKNKYLNNQLYISSIEFGTELSNAQGSIFFTDYSVNID